jgi:hypothetical protein
MGLRNFRPYLALFGAIGALTQYKSLFQRGDFTKIEMDVKPIPANRAREDVRSGDRQVSVQSPGEPCKVYVTYTKGTTLQGKLHSILEKFGCGFFTTSFADVEHEEINHDLRCLSNSAFIVDRDLAQTKSVALRRFATNNTVNTDKSQLNSHVVATYATMKSASQLQQCPNTTSVLENLNGQSPLKVPTM